MYATYNYRTGSVAPNILADILKMLTGETNTANLSADCVTANTSILNSVSNAGWSVHDIQMSSTTAWTKTNNHASMTTLTHTATALDWSNTEKGLIYFRHNYVNGTTTHTLKFYKSAADRTADTNAISSGTMATASGTMTLTGATGWTQVFTAPGADVTNQDGTIASSYAGAILRAAWHADNGGSSAGYNYIAVDLNTAGYVYLPFYESWNAVTHAGTNAVTAYNSASYGQRISTANGGYLYLSAQAGHSCCLWSLQSGSYGISASNSPTFIGERTRRSAWDTNANAYPVLISAISISTSGYCFGSSATINRMVLNTGADGTNQTINMGTDFNMSLLANAHMTPASTYPSDSSKTLKHGLWRFVCGSVANGFIGGDCSAYTDVWATTASQGAALDEITIGGSTYVVWTTGSTYGNRLAVRKG